MQNDTAVKVLAIGWHGAIKATPTRRLGAI